MSAIKARWRTYNQLKSLASKMPNDHVEFKIEDFRSVLASIAEEWKLDQGKLANLSGLPPLVVAAIMGNSRQDNFHTSSRNPFSELSLASDTKKLINGLISWISPSEAELVTLESEKVDTHQVLVALGAHARVFLDLSSSGISQLEAELCNLTKTNKIELLAEIASAMINIRDQLPATGFGKTNETEALRREILELQVKVQALSAERDRLYALVEKLTDQPSQIKSAFLQSIGNLPLMVASGAVGMLCGPEQAQAMISYVQSLVAITASGG
jgi:hypothetical protein